MCGRLNQFTKLPALSLAGRELRAERRQKEREDKRASVQVVNNICPTDYADVVTSGVGGPGLERMRFGLIPAWARGNKAVVARKFLHTFNARSESVFELASYRGPVLKQRCLIPVRGWHEWPDSRTPYFIHRRDDAPLWLAGIWDEWQSRDPLDAPGGPLITSMSVITTPPGRYMGQFHDRSPLVLEDAAAAAWLDLTLRADDIRAFFKPYESEHLEAYRVSTLANQARNKSDAVCVPIAAPVPQARLAPSLTENEGMPPLNLF